MISFLLLLYTVGPEETDSKDGLGAGDIASISLGVIILVYIAIDCFCCFRKERGLIFSCYQTLCRNREGNGVTKANCKCTAVPFLSARSLGVNYVLAMQHDVKN